MVDVSSRVIGVTRSGIDHAPGISFAIPADTVSWVCQQLNEHGKVKRATLGISIAKRSVPAGTGHAIIKMTVKSVRDPASSAFRELDVLMRFNGESVQDVRDLDRALASVVDERAMVQVMRDEEVLDLSVPLRFVD